MTSDPDRERALTKEQVQKRADQVSASKQGWAQPPSAPRWSEHRAILERLQAKLSANPWTLLPHEPRYRVTIKWGRRLQPWIAEVQPTSNAVTR